MEKSRRPIVAVAMGDAAGIGPEITVKALDVLKDSSDLDVLVVGDSGIIQKALDVSGVTCRINRCESAEQAEFASGTLNLVDLENLSENIFAKGEVDPAIGKAAVEYTEVAVKMALAGEVDAIVSAPVNKEAVHLAGYDFAGGTELIAHLTKCENFAMVLILGPIRLFYLTNHVSMREALEKVKKDIIIKKLRSMNEALTEMGFAEAQIGVAAFNPHCGEGGAMGREEIDEISPAIEEAQREGINAQGPFPADTIFVRGKEGAFDGILCMYHDQGNIALKLLDFGAGVTFIAGLPIIRTSVAHGTAYDIAGQGIASEDTLVAALKTAAEIARKKGRVH